MELITLKEALNTIHSGEKFSISFVTADRSRKSGGEIREYEDCVLSSIKDDKFRTSSRHNENPFIIKRQNHYAHATRNILLPNGKIRKIHIWLITRINGNKVTLY